MTVFFRQFWEDYRLAFSHELENVESLILPDEYIQEVWVPDVFIENGKTEFLHTITVVNKEFRIFSNGTVWYSQRYF